MRTATATEVAAVASAKRRLAVVAVRANLYDFE